MKIKKLNVNSPVECPFRRQEYPQYEARSSEMCSHESIQDDLGCYDDNLFPEQCPCIGKVIKERVNRDIYFKNKENKDE